jgi:hypothetical protein
VYLCKLKKELLSTDSSLLLQEHIDKWGERSKSGARTLQPAYSWWWNCLILIIFSNLYHHTRSRCPSRWEHYDSDRFSISPVSSELDLDRLSYFRPCLASVSSRLWRAVLFKHPRHICRNVGCLVFRQVLPNGFKPPKPHFHPREIGTSEPARKWGFVRLLSTTLYLKPIRLSSICESGVLAAS